METLKEINQALSIIGYVDRLKINDIIRETAENNKIEGEYLIEFPYDIYDVKALVNVKHVTSPGDMGTPAVDEYIPEINYMLITK
jgi:hypothetical protein